MGARFFKAVAGVVVALVAAYLGYYFLWMYPRYSVPVLMYHTFDQKPELLSVEPEIFERQMRYLKEKGFDVISLDELVWGMKSGRRFSRRTAVITVDDGERSVFAAAYPVLKKYGFPATVFLITDRIGVWPDYLTWEEVREMARSGISFGGHTRGHYYLPSGGTEDVLRDQIAGCKKAIEEKAGIPAEYFCYPLGGFTAEAKVLVEEAGYKGALSTNRGGDALNRKDFYELNRISARNDDPYFSPSNISGAFKFRGKVSGYYNLFKKKKTEKKKKAVASDSP